MVIGLNTLIQNGRFKEVNDSAHHLSTKLNRWEVLPKSMLVKFEVYNDGEYWCARGIGEDIFTQGKTLDELVNNTKEAVEVHFTELLEKGEEIKILTLSELNVSIQVFFIEGHYHGKKITPGGGEPSYEYNNC